MALQERAVLRQAFPSMHCGRVDLLLEPSHLVMTLEKV